MKCSDFIAKKLSKYSDFVFSGQGGSVVHILDSFSKIKKIKIIPSQNEQGASLAADAYYRATKKIGIVVARVPINELLLFQPLENGLASEHLQKLFLNKQTNNFLPHQIHQGIFPAHRV